jgi:hypothetical protein
MGDLACQATKNWCVNQYKIDIAEPNLGVSPRNEGWVRQNWELPTIKSGSMFAENWAAAVSPWPVSQSLFTQQDLSPLYICFATLT